MKKKASIILLLISAICVLSLTVGIAFSYYKKSDSGWGHTISTTSILFQMNGKNYLDEVTSEDFNISRGEEKSVSLIVQVYSQATFQTKYNITFQLNSEGERSLAEAIEVYEYIDGSYEFAYMLSEIENHIIEGHMYTNSPQTHQIKLVYSAEAGAYYEGNSFTLSAVGNVVLEDSDTIYINGVTATEKAESFASIMSDSQNSGKTLVLNSNITTTSEINCVSNIGIDLNGNTITLGGDLSIAYSTVTQNGLGIVSTLSGGNIIFNGYNLNLNTIDAYKIYDAIDETNINIFYSQNLIDDLSDDISTSIEELSNSGVLFQTGDIIDFCKDYKLYFKKGVSISASEQTANVMQIAQTGENIYKAIIKSIDNTDNCDIDLNLYWTDGTDSFSQVVNKNLNVRGSSVQAIANALADEIPSIINGNLFLKVFDRATDSTITWLVEDNFNGELLNAEGLFLQNGYEDFSSYTDKQVEIYIIVDNAGTKYVKYIERVCEILPLQKRVEIFYDNAEPILNESGGEGTFDLSSSIDSVLAEKVGLDSFSITLDETSNRLDGSRNYLSVANGIVSVENSPASNKNVKVLADISFVFDDRLAPNNSFVIENKDFIVMGASASYESISVQESLQRAFDVNPYVQGESYVFDATAYLSSGVFVEYQVPNEYANYIFVQNDIFEKNYAGNFLLSNDNYTYFSRRSRVEVGEGTGVYTYEPDDNGAYIYIDSTTILDYETNKESVYNLRSQFSLLPQRIPSTSLTSQINAYLFDYDENGEKVYRTEQVTVEGETVTQRLSYILNLDIDGIYHNDAQGIADYYLYNALLSYYDKNKDGELQVSESSATWSSITVNGATYKVVGIPSAEYLASATYLDGIISNTAYPQESYKTLSSINNGNGNVYYYIDVSNVNLSSLTGVEYFTYAEGYSFNNNLIIDLSKMQGLTHINYLSLANNLISDINAISYFDNLEYLDIGDCQVTDISAIQYLENLIYVDIANNKNINSFEALADDEKLVSVNASGIDANTQESSFYYFNLIYANNANASIITNEATSVTYARNSNYIAAAEALYQLQTIYNIYQYFYAPVEVYYGGEAYTLRWTTSEPSSIDITRIGDVDQFVGNHYLWTINSPAVNKRVSIYVSVVDSIGNNVGTMANSFNVSLLKNPEAVAEIQLTDGGTNVNALSVVPDTQLLSKLFDYFDTNDDALISFTELQTNYSSDSVDFKNLGITNLTGIEHFSNALANKNLLLVGNSINDLTPLSHLSISGLTLDGKEYDFNELVNASEGDGDENVGTLTSLTYLEVYGSYNLDNSDVLGGLYNVYLRNSSVKIYLVPLEAAYNRLTDTDSLAWDPYALELPKQVQSLVSYHNFEVLKETLVIENGQIQMTFYGKPLDFSISAYEFSVAGKRTTANTDSLGLFSISNYTITYAQFAGVDETVFLRLTIESNDGRSTVSYNQYYIELQASSNPNIYLVEEENGQTTFTSFDNIFYGRSVRNYLFKKLSSDVFVSSNLVNIVGDITVTQLGNGYYYDSQNDSYYLTEATLADKLTAPNDSNANLNGNKPSGSFLIIDGTCVPGAWEAGGNIISGLRYLPSVTKIYINRDANVGDGKDLNYITHMYVRFSALDLSSLNIACTSMELLDLSNSSGPFTILGRGNDCYLKYFPNLTTLNLVYASISDWSCFDYYNTTEGKQLIQTHISSDPLRYVTIAGTGTTNTNHNSTTSKAIFDGIYATYDEFSSNTPQIKIGTQSSTTATSLLSAWGTYTAYSVTELNEYRAVSNYIFDLGLKVNGTYSFNLATDKVSENDVITLPTTTGDEFFGTAYYGNKYFNREFPVVWTVYQITTLGNLPTPITVSSGTYTVGSQEAMLVIVGTIGGDIDNATPQNYFYEFLANDSDNSSSLGKYIDSSLRLYIYSEGITNSQTSFNLTSGNAIKASVATKFGLSNIVNAIDFADSSLSNSYSTFSVVSLDGMESFTSLTNLSINNQALSDISAIASMTALVNVDLSNDYVSSVSEFANLTHLTSLNLSNNKVKTLAPFNNAIVLSTLTTLNLNYNPLVSPSDLAYLKKTSSVLSTLNIMGTNLSGRFDALVDLSLMMSASGLTSLNLALNSEIAESVTISAIDAFINAISNDVANNFTLPSTLVTSGTYTQIDVSYTYSINDYYVNNSTVIGDGTMLKVVFGLSGSAQLNNIIYEKAFNQQGVVQPQIVVGSNSYEINDFDSALFIYLISKPNSSSPYLMRNSDNDYVINPANTTLTISENVGITSLKKLSILGFATVSISSNPITELWTESYPELTSFTLSDATVTASQVYTAINSSSTLATLDLLKSYGVDYYNVVTGTTTLLQYLDSVTSLKTLKINNEYNLKNFGANSINEALISIVNSFSAKYNSLDVLTSYDKLGKRHSFYGVNKTYKVKLKIENPSIFTKFGFSNYGVEESGNVLLNDTITSIASNISDENREASDNNWYSIPTGVTLSLDQIAGGMLTLPQYVMFFGEEYNISWSVLNVKNSSNVIVQNAIAINASEVVTADTTKEVASFSLKATTAFGSASINISTGTATSTANYMNYYFETDVNGDFLDEEGNVYFENTGYNVETLYYYQDNYYYTSPDASATTVYAVKAGEIVSSGRFLAYLFKHSTISGKSWDSALVSAKKTCYQELGLATINGYILLKDSILSVRSMDTISTSSDSSFGNSSIQGVEIFKNVVTIGFTSGCFVDISPLSNLHLVSFQYYNSQYTKLSDNYRIYDFKPLVQGSKDTLETFVYNGFGGASFDDLSFLLSFTNLKNVYLLTKPESTQLSNGSGKAMQEYIETPFFKYIVCRLLESGVNVYIGNTSTTQINWAISSWEKEAVASKVIVYGSKTTVVDGETVVTYNYLNTYAYRLIANKDYDRASDVLSRYSASNLNGATMENNFQVVVNSGSYIPAYINDGGAFYAVSYVGDSVYLKYSDSTSGYKLVKGGLTVGGVTYQENQYLTKAEAQEILNCVEFLIANNRGLCDIVFEVDFVASGETRMVAGISLDDGYYYERMITVIKE